MGSSRVLRGLVALTFLTSFVAACGDDDDDATPVEETDDGGTEEVEAQTIDITMADYSYPEAPTELDAGLVTMNLTNDGEVVHEAAFLEIGDAPLEAFLEDFTAAFTEEGAPLPAELGEVSAPLELEAGESGTATFTISEGTYAMLCTFEEDAEEEAAADAAEAAGEASQPEEGEDEEEQPTDPAKIHYNRGMVQVVTVNAGDSDPQLPDADATITGSDWTFESDFDAGDTSFNWVNDGPNEIHFVGISEYDSTDSAAVEEAFLAGFSEDGPPEGTLEPSNEDFAFGGVFSAGQGQHVEMDQPFESGKTYLLVCFLTDRAGSPPHAFPEDQGGHGMYKAFTVE